jgi:uncharacterized protein
MSHPVVHFEVSGKDLDKLQKFYGELFGWKTQKAQGDMPYAMVEKEDGGIAGGIGQAPDGNGHVTFYVDTDDLRRRSTRPSSSAARRSSP